MSMSFHVVGFKPPDAKFHQMKKIWDACREADIYAPIEVQAFFEDQQPDPKGIEVEIPTKEWHSEWYDGFEVSLDDIPDGVKILRFYVSC